MKLITDRLNAKTKNIVVDFADEFRESVCDFDRSLLNARHIFRNLDGLKNEHKVWDSQRYKTLLGCVHSMQKSFIVMQNESPAEYAHLVKKWGKNILSELDVFCAQYMDGYSPDKEVEWNRD